jgi:hypothetical protein
MTELVIFIFFVLVAANFIHGFKQGVHYLINPIFIVSVLFIMLYYLPYFSSFVDYEQNFWVSKNKLEDFFTYLLLCYALFSLGFNTYHPTITSINTQAICYKRVELFGILFGILGFTFYAYFILKSGITTIYSGHGKADFSVGGYIYEMRYFIFSSVLILGSLIIQGLASNKAKFIFYTFIIFLIIDAFFRQQRGSWIRLALIYSGLYIYYLINSNQSLNVSTIIKNNSKLIIYGLFFSFMVIGMVGLRYMEGETTIEKFINFVNSVGEDSSILLHGSGNNTGNEFIIAFNGFISAVQLNSYDLGLKWVQPFLNFIPRAIWEDKPYWETFSVSVTETINRFGYIYPPGGIAETGAIDTFFRFGWFSPLFFLILGFFAKKVYVSGLYGSERGNMILIVFLISFIYFITQNMFPFVVFGLYMLIPIVLTYFFARLRYRYEN